MRSTFRVLFYTKNQAIKNGRVPVMGRITVNGTTASFSCKRDVPLVLWDAKGNCAKDKSEEARRLNRELENIKAQIGKHYQYLSDHDSYLTAKKVYDRYNGFGEEIHSLMETISRSGITNGRSARRKPKAPTEGWWTSTSVCPVI